MRDKSIPGGSGVGVAERGSPDSADVVSLAALRRTARVTGMWYLAMGVTGILGFLLIRPQIYVSGQPADTLANLVGDAPLARLGLVAELALVVTQALAAVWFYKLFRASNHVAAWALAVFGLMNAAAIMASAGFLATALTVSGDPGLAPGGDAAALVQLMYELSSNSWGVGALFFGLWLVPMGYLVTDSDLMPVWLGRILMIGGLGYLVSAFVSYGFAMAPGWLVEGLTVPATIGEFWMIIYLLAVGVRRDSDPTQMPSPVGQH
jgi:hypothetical protein